MSPRTSAAPPSLSSAPPTGSRWRRWADWLYFFGPALLLMGLIFAASTDVGSSAHSSHILRPLLEWLGLKGWLAPEPFDRVNYVIRKTGHVTEYALLAMLLHRAFAFARAPRGSGRARWAPGLVLTVLAVVALYAGSDEFHQSFVASRTASAWDALLDTAGGSIGLALKWGWERGRRWKRR